MSGIDKIIEIARKCKEENIEINGNTIYDGYKIGRAIIKLR